MQNFFISLAASVAFVAPASATQVFSENFDSENGGLTALNFTGFSQFASTGMGNVDLVRTPDFGIICAGGSGSCVDLDGTPGPGEIETLSSFSFAAGKRITFSFDVSGSQRGTIEDFLFGIRSQNGLIAYNNIRFTSTCCGSGAIGNDLVNNLDFGGIGFETQEPFGNISVSFDSGSTGSIKLYFGSLSSDNIGILIDNVSLDIGSVPEPASWALMIAGFGLVGGAMRRRTSVRYVTA